MADKLDPVAPMVSEVPNDLEYAAIDTPIAPIAEPPVDGAEVVAVEDIAVGRWDAGFCSCFDNFVPNCLMAYFCPCFTIGQITHRLGLFPFMQTVLVVGGLLVGNIIFSSLASSSSRTYVCDTDSFYFVSCHWTGTSYTFFYYLSLACSIIVVAMVFQLRVRFRARFEIPGSQLEDCLIGFFCSCCAIAQMASHAKSYKPGQCSFGPPDQLPAFQ